MNTDSERLSRLERQVNELADEVLDHLRTTSEPTPPATTRAWVDMDITQARRALEELREWMSTVLIHHPRVMARMRPCWYRHPAVVQILLDVRAAWMRAYRSDPPDLVWALDWWQRHVPNLAQALADEMGHCSSVRHEPEDSSPPIADEDAVEEYLQVWTSGRPHRTETGDSTVDPLNQEAPTPAVTTSVHFFHLGARRWCAYEPVQHKKFILQFVCRRRLR